MVGVRVPLGLQREEIEDANYVIAESITEQHLKKYGLSSSKDMAGVALRSGNDR